MVRILVLKTNIDSPAGREKIAVQLNAIPTIRNWSLDPEGDHSLLVIGSTGVSADEIIKLVKEAGFEGEEI